MLLLAVLVPYFGFIFIQIINSNKKARHSKADQKNSLNESKEDFHSKNDLVILNIDDVYIAI